MRQLDQVAAALFLRPKYAIAGPFEPDDFVSSVRPANDDADPNLWAPVDLDDPRTKVDLRDFASSRFARHRPQVFEAHRIHAWVTKWVMGDVCGYTLRAASATETQRRIATYYANLFKANVGHAFKGGPWRRGLVTPRSAVVAEACGCSEITVLRWLRAMTERGLLVTRRGGGGEGLMVVAVDPRTRLIFCDSRPPVTESWTRSLLEPDHQRERPKNPEPTEAERAWWRDLQATARALSTWPADLTERENVTNREAG